MITYPNPFNLHNQPFVDTDVAATWEAVKCDTDANLMSDTQLKSLQIFGQLYLVDRSDAINSRRLRNACTVDFVHRAKTTIEQDSELVWYVEVPNTRSCLDESAAIQFRNHFNRLLCQQLSDSLGGAVLKHLKQPLCDSTYVVDARILTTDETFARLFPVFEYIRAMVLKSHNCGCVSPARFAQYTKNIQKEHIRTAIVPGLLKTYFRLQDDNLAISERQYARLVDFLWRIIQHDDGLTLAPNSLTDVVLLKTENNGWGEIQAVEYLFNRIVSSPLFRTKLLELLPQYQFAQVTIQLYEVEGNINGGWTVTGVSRILELECYLSIYADKCDITDADLCGILFNVVEVFPPGVKREHVNLRGVNVNSVIEITLNNFESSEDGRLDAYPFGNIYIEPVTPSKPYHQDVA